ncbi:short-chain dehydrogenase/reductase SDR [Catenulispora acidiphila DSM 44928]|uniref:Short-chain dehydrogenase/reductase SDR n=1 Tax=Catenulispora acidiphila (strain DSM 44928 / JCM 14897 / NBRC 102108 / NRRL B-24433 / ID139908) TaxID=479433 RepID=C7PWE4_CATAD|nr:SDR family oxidoreductase [Catenulispora acidiphila]ACU75224.1 short-chain dehydrogenase/reductase SDR [Catenulispora acidiphila DSM 44928]
MPTSDLTGTTALVTGAAKGFGRAVTAALVAAGVRVVAVVRDQSSAAGLTEEFGGSVVPVVADAADPVAAGSLLEKYRPRTVVLNAGVTPLGRPLQMHTWESFSRTWEVDVKQAFSWAREALLLPLDPGTTVVSVSSGAAIGGSPLSGGYAGAKATVRFVSSYAAGEAASAGLGIRFVAVLPMMSPQTSVGANGAAAYAARQGVPVEDFIAGMGPTLTPEQVGKAVLDIASDTSFDQLAYLLKPNGPAAL